MTTPTTPAPLEKIADLTRQAVQEVFQSMLNLEMRPGPAAPLAPEPEGEIVSSVGFIGELTGVICLYAPISFAKVITGRMLELPPEKVDASDMVNDTMGELANMVVGYVKSHLCDGGLACTMTIPSIVRGQQLSVEASAQIRRTVLGFSNGSQHLLAEVLLKEP